MTDGLRAQYQQILAKCEFLETVLHEEARFISEESLEELDLLLDRKSRYIQQVLKLDIDLRAAEDEDRREGGVQTLDELDADRAGMRASISREMERLAGMQNANREALALKQEALQRQFEGCLGAMRRAEAYIAYGDM